MPTPDPRDTPTLVAHILDRFHEGHRRDLPPLIAQAEAAVAPALAAHLRAMERALESHMFKEEMRLFPMLEQGGHSLAGQLIDDLVAEHRDHDAAIEMLNRLMAEATLPAALEEGLCRFVDELQAHVQVEDEVLFPRFPHRPDARLVA